MKIKIKIIFLSLICVPILLLNSCAYTPIFYDPSIPIEEACTILFVGVHISEYNGITIPPKRKHSNYNESPWNYVVLPPGEMSFAADIFWSHTIGNYRTYYTGKDVKFNFKFDKGLEYIVQFGIKNDVWGVDIYQMKIPKAYVSLPKDKHVAFIPLKK